jgi:hypothetical protein
MRAGANGCNQLGIPKGIRLPLPSLLKLDLKAFHKLDECLQRHCLAMLVICPQSLRISCEGGMKASTHPTMRPYEGDEMQDSEESKESKAEANVIRPRRHDCVDRKKRRKQKSRRDYNLTNK